MGDTPTGRVQRARDLYGRQVWSQAFDALAIADREEALAADDLERLAVAAYLIGADDTYLEALDRAHQAYVSGGETLRGARCAFWIGLRLMFRGETGRAGGWLARAERLLDAEGECVERGYLLLPEIEGAAASR